MKKWDEYAKKVGIISGKAYKHLFRNHEHILVEHTGDETAYVKLDDAIKAIKIAEKNLNTRNTIL